MATIEYMHCCGVKELVGIGYHKTPLMAMKSICQSQWNRYTKRLNDFNPMIIFTAVVGYKDGLDEDYSLDEGESITYGPDFAAFIEKNRLGVVKVVSEKYNELNHPSHLVRVWMWEPNNTNLKRWWTRINTPKKAVRRVR